MNYFQSKISGITLILCVTALLMSSCSPKIPFTQSIREQYKLKDNELTSLQFYISQDLSLNRGEKSEGGQDTDEGKLTITSGSYLERVFIKAGTPGIVEKVIDGNRFAVSFEVGENTALIFGAPSPKTNERYTLLAPEWINGKGKLLYKDKTYYTAQGSANVHLLFQLKRIRKFKKEQRVVKGRKI
ncbi:MAG: hypothetical protein ABII90_05260 [Bacteroidota bacterium]